MDRCTVLVLLLVSASAVAPTVSSGSSGWPDGAYNPYGNSTVQVAVDRSNLTGSAPEYLPEVAGAERFWEEGGNGELNFSVRFERTGNVSRAHILVSFHEAASVPCGREEHGVGCGGFGNLTRPGIVRLAMYTDGFQWRPVAVLGETVRHEFGHALGLDHSDDPSDIMYPRNAGLRSDPATWNAYLQGGILIPALFLGFLVVFWTVVGRGDEGSGGEGRDGERRP